ncbi:hypothetical protein EXS70_01355 [Candidatus Peribacteria bacterium]|nr:hypothetical protein [Candidatus Peribacteria bacterium]
MTQFHPFQRGIFHITTNAKDKEPWCTFGDTPYILISNLMITKHLHNARIYAFCILPDHMHIIMKTGRYGISTFMKSFKENSSREIRRYRKHLADSPDVDVGSGDAVVAAEFPIRPAVAADSPIATDRFGGVFHGWQHGFDSSYIKKDEPMPRLLRYVHHNAARHRLVRSADDWPWTSLHFRRLLDEIK